MNSISFTGAQTRSCEKFAQRKEQELAKYLAERAQQKKTSSVGKKSITEIVKEVRTEQNLFDRVEIQRSQRKGKKPAHVRLLDFLFRIYG